MRFRKATTVLLCYLCGYDVQSFVVNAPDQRSDSCLSSSTRSGAESDRTSQRKAKARPPRNFADDSRFFVKEAVETLQQTGLRAGARRSTEAAFAGFGAALEVARNLLDGVRDGTPPTEALAVLSPKALRKLFERLGATYIKIGQVC